MRQQQVEAGAARTFDDVGEEGCAEPAPLQVKAIGEPPLMLAISVWLAIRDAIASLADYRLVPKLDAPATPERVLAAIEDVRGRAGL